MIRFFAYELSTLLLCANMSYYFRQSGYVLPSVCHSVCLSVRWHLRVEMKDTKICLWTLKITLNFGVICAWITKIQN